MYVEGTFYKMYGSGFYSPASVSNIVLDNKGFVFLTGVKVIF